DADVRTPRRRHLPGPGAGLRGDAPGRDRRRRPERRQRGGRGPVPRRRHRLPRHPPRLPRGARPSSVRSPAHARSVVEGRRLGPPGGSTLENLTFLWNIWYGLQVAFGIGLLIVLHELGHFLLAKWNGVKVEKFSIGFGRTLLGFTRGETEYVLAA